ncbi:hypothetical protein F3Y22_tig00005929pilonHSYRG00003 [Hibiscus syriacus]|uniref:Uncharacterized protein n=1 Tax=Hibiscus syriacus TaxID=106335 RepID=A0A6A3CCF5_HIBSY|nr:hypothetical protein F3Y22_tig00005929pilonHSYRG00003 [Hibiscus syriacus]
MIPPYEAKTRNGHCGSIVGESRNLAVQSSFRDGFLHEIGFDFVGWADNGDPGCRIKQNLQGWFWIPLFMIMASTKLISVTILKLPPPPPLIAKTSLSPWFSVKNPSINVNELSIHHIVTGSWEGKSSTLLCNSIIKFTERGTGLNPCNFIFYVGINRSEVNQVDDDEWDFSDKLNTFVIMAATSGSRLQPMFSGTINSGLSHWKWSWKQNHLNEGKGNGEIFDEGILPLKTRREQPKQEGLTRKTEETSFS